MSRLWLRRSLAKWHRKLAHRQRRLKVSVRHHRPNSAKKWRKLVDEAHQKIARREKQLRARTPMRLRALDQMLAWARGHVVEEGGNNIGPVVSKIIREAGGTPGEPWCGDTVAASYLRAGSKMVSRAWAYVPTLAKLLMRVRNPAGGHVVTYDFQGDGTEDHTGVFVRWIDRALGDFEAVEGNTGTDGARSDGQGDGVHVRRRNVHTHGARFYRVLR